MLDPAQQQNPTINKTSIIHPIGLLTKNDKKPNNIASTAGTKKITRKTATITTTIIPMAVAPNSARNPKTILLPLHHLNYNPLDKILINILCLKSDIIVYVFY